MDKAIYHVDMLLFLLENSKGSSIPIEEYKEIIYAARDYRDDLVFKKIWQK